MKKVGSFFTLLTSKGYKKVVLIPLAFCLGFFLYSLYKNFTGGDIDKTVYDDGTTRISAQSDLGSVKLPKILDSLNIPIHNDLKIRNYDLLLDKDENITSIDIYCKSDKDANEIIDWSEPLTTDTLRVLESQGSWVVVASVSQLNLPSYPHSSYGSYIVYLSTYT